MRSTVSAGSFGGPPALSYHQAAPHICTPCPQPTNMNDTSHLGFRQKSRTIVSYLLADVETWVTLDGSIRVHVDVNVEFSFCPVLGHVCERVALLRVCPHKRNDNEERPHQRPRNREEAPHRPHADSRRRRKGGSHTKTRVRLGAIDGEETCADRTRVLCSFASYYVRRSFVESLTGKVAELHSQASGAVRISGLCALRLRTRMLQLRRSASTPA